MKIKTQKPYFYFSYDPLAEDIGYKTVLLNIVTKRFKDLIKFNLQDEGELRRHSVHILFLMNAVDLAQRVGRLEQMIQQLEVVFDIVNNSMSMEEESTCLAYSKVIDRLTKYEEEEHYAREIYYEAMKDKSARPIRKFKSMFNYYKELHTDNYAIVSTFPAFCYGVITKDKRTIEEFLDLETREKIEFLSSNIILKKYPVSLLTKGCNRHIRNATSHEHRHTFVNNNQKVRLVDVNFKGKTVYDKTFSISEFEDVLRDLMITVSSLRCALAIFNINHIKEINRHLPTKTYTPEEIEKMAFTCAKDSFFDYQSMKISDNKVAFVVKVQDRKKIKSVTISLGPLSTTVPIPAVPEARQQLARFLQLVFYNTGQIFEKMEVILIDLKDELVGKLEIDTVNFKTEDANIFLEKAIKDTIPENYSLER